MADVTNAALDSSRSSDTLYYNAWSNVFLGRLMEIAQRSGLIAAKDR